MLSDKTVPDMTIPVKELKDRYGIGKQAEINRRKHLGIVPQKVDGVYVVDEDQLSLLDQLDEFLSSRPGVKMTDFKVESTGNGEFTIPNDPTVMEATLVDSSEPSPVWSGLAVRNDESEYMMELVETIAHAITPPNPIAHWERLVWLVDNKIIITTSEVQALVGTRPKGKQWTRGSFVFTRTDKLGTQYGWTVSKLHSEE